MYVTGNLCLFLFHWKCDWKQNAI